MSKFECQANQLGPYQAVIYLTTSTYTPPSSSEGAQPALNPEASQRLLDRALTCLLRAAAAENSPAEEQQEEEANDEEKGNAESKTKTKTLTPTVLYKLRYVQRVAGNNSPAPTSTSTSASSNPVFSFPASPTTPATTNPNLGLLSFDDASLDAVRTAWELVMRRAKSSSEKKDAVAKEEGGENGSGKETPGGDDGDKDGGGDDEAGEYMVFQDREGVGSDHGHGDDGYD